MPSSLPSSPGWHLYRPRLPDARLAGVGSGYASDLAVCSATWPSTFCSTWCICPFSTVTEPNGRSSASACGRIRRAPAPWLPDRPHRDVREHDDRRRMRHAGEIRLSQASCSSPSDASVPSLKFSTLLRPTKCTPPWSKLYQRLAVAVVIEVLQIAGRRRRRSRRVRPAPCARDRRGSRSGFRCALPNSSGFDRWLTSPVCTTNAGASRQRVDVGDRAAQAADDVGIRILVKADVRVADLHERQRICLRRSQRRVAVRVAPSARGTPPATVHTTAAPLQLARHFNACRRVSVGVSGVLRAHLDSLS